MSDVCRPHDRAPREGEPAVIVSHLSYTFAGRALPTLDDLTFELPVGSWTWLAGPSGSGKSTLLRALAGWIPRHAHGQMRGTVLVAGCDTRRATTGELARAAGLVLQVADEQICTTSVRSELACGLENLAWMPSAIAERIAETSERFGLQDLLDAPPRRLSGGQKQRVVLAAIWAMRPRVLLLDEPLAQLDAAAAEALVAELARLRDEGMTIVAAEHRRDRFERLVDQQLWLEHGRLVEPRAAPDPRRLRALPSKSPRGEPAVRVNQLGYRFADTERWLLRDLNFTIEPGQRVAVVGPNGAGKSTLLALLSEQLAPTTGTVCWTIGDDALSAHALLPQNPDWMLFHETVRAELAFGPEQRSLLPDEVRGRVLRVSDALGLGELLVEPPQALSQGQRLRVALGALLTLQPRVLLLDEPTAGQDAELLDQLLDALDASLEAGLLAAVVVATHDERLIQHWADRLLTLDHRSLRDELPAESRAANVSNAAPEGVAPLELQLAEVVDQTVLPSWFVRDASAPAWLVDIDPRVKIVWLMALSTLMVTWQETAPLGVLAVLGAGPIFLLRLSGRWWLGVVGLVVLAAWGALLTQALFYDQEPRTVLLALGPVTLWREGVADGLHQSLRLLGPLLAGVCVATTTSPERLLAGLVALRVPNVVAFLAMTSLAALPVLVDEWSGIRQAQAERGYRFRGWGRAGRRGASWRVELGLLVPLLASVLRRSRSLAVALVARGFDPQVPRTWYPALRLTLVEKLVVAGLVVTVVVAVAGQFAAP